ncbi:MAG: hypothetical protein R2702_01130 [Acidimicrobiales bacterium]
MTPSSKRLAAVNPAWVKTPSILRFWSSTDAVNPEMPASRAASARYSRARWPCAPVVLVVDEEGDLGIAAGAVAVVAGHAHEVVADQPDERHAVDVVDVGEALDVSLGQAGPGREEAEVDALGRLALVEGDDALGIVGSDGAHGHGAAVGQDHLGLPPLRVGLRALRVLGMPRRLPR